jgi:hypothetical protein
MSFRSSLWIVLCLCLASPVSAQFKEAAEDPKGPKLGEPKVLRWQAGVIITAASGPCKEIVGYAPLPVAWPEQELSIAEQEISPGVKVRHEMLEGTVDVMTVSIPILPAGQEAKALVTYEIRRHAIVAPTQTDIYELPERKHLARDVLQFLGPSLKIESNNAKIKALAKELGADKEKAWQKVEAIYDWVRQKVPAQHAQNEAVKGAVAALRDGNGNNEDAVSLFIAISRASGVPARTVWVPDHCYPEFYLIDDDGKGHWFPCEMSGARSFGGISETRPILQKGDNFRPPYNKKERQRYLAEYLTGTGGKPTHKFIRQLLAAP